MRIAAGLAVRRAADGGLRRRPRARRSACVRGTGTRDGFFYRSWKEHAGSACMTLGADGSYSLAYDLGDGNLVAGLGWAHRLPRPPDRLSRRGVRAWDQQLPRAVRLVDRSAGRILRRRQLGQRGFTPPGEGALVLGTVETDGGTYEIYRTTRVDGPSIRGTATFDQFWSVRTVRRPHGRRPDDHLANHVEAFAPPRHGAGHDELPGHGHRRLRQHRALEAWRCGRSSPVAF